MAVKQIIGKAPCGTCGEEIPVKQNESGGLSLCCPWCDVRKYTAAGTQADKIERAKVKREPEPEPIGNPSETPPKNPIPPAKKPGNFFTP